MFFERVLQALEAAKVPPAQTAYVWDRFLDFELHFGDLASYQRLEQRRAEALGQRTMLPACVTRASPQRLMASAGRAWCV